MADTDDEKNPFNIEDDDGIDDWVGDAEEVPGGDDAEGEIDDWVQAAEQSTAGGSPALRSLSTSEDQASPGKLEAEKKPKDPMEKPQPPIATPAPPVAADPATAEPFLPALSPSAPSPQPAVSAESPTFAPPAVAVGKSAAPPDQDWDRQQAPPVTKDAPKQERHVGEIEEVEEKPEVVEEEEVENSAQQQEQDAERGPAGGWGWGGGWGLGAIGGTLKAVAAGAVRDVKELTGSFQAALAEVEDSSDDEKTPAADGATPSPSKRTAAERSTARGVPPNTSAPVPPKPTRMPPAAAVASREAGEGAQAPREAPLQQEADRTLPTHETPDPELELGLKVIDEQVEQLASGAAKALSSLWGGLSGVARNTATLVSKVEAVTKTLAADLVSGSGVGEDVAQLQAAASSGVRGVAANVTRIGTRLERGLETVGRTALGLIEEVTGQYGRGGSGGGATHGRPDPQHFEDYFYLYGGQQLCEELEGLANECARTCNKARTRLEAAQQAELDATLAALGPLFSAALRAGAGGGTATADGGEDVARAREQLDHRYAPVSYLCQDSQVRAEAFQQQLLTAVEHVTAQALAAAKAAAAAAEAAAAKAAAPPTGVPDAAAGEPGDGGGDAVVSGAVEVAAAKEGGEGHNDAEEEEGWEVEEEAEGSKAEGGEVELEGRMVHAALASLQAHAVKRLAELATAQVQLLVEHGNSVAAPARSARVMQDSVAWPAAPTQQAALLREQCSRMVSDLHTVAGAYGAAVSALLKVLPAPTRPALASRVQAASAPPTPAADSGDGSQALAASEEGAGNTEAAAAVGKPTAAQTQGASSASAGNVQAVEVGEGEAALALERELQIAGSTAVGRVEEGFRGLLYAVLVRELVTCIAAGGAGEEGDDA